MKELNNYFIPVTLIYITVILLITLLYYDTIYIDDSLALMFALSTVSAFFCHDYLVNNNIYIKFLLLSVFLILFCFTILCFFEFPNGEFILISGLSLFVLLVNYKLLYYLYYYMFNKYPKLDMDETVKLDDKEKIKINGYFVFLVFLSTILLYNISEFILEYI